MMQQFASTPGAVPGKFPQNPQPAVRFKQGLRTVILIVPTLDLVRDLATPLDPKEDPEAVYDLLAEPDPDGRVGRNRPRSRAHVKGIAHYLQNSKTWVLGSITAVAKPGTVNFVTQWQFDDTRAIGYVEVPRFDANLFDVVDGGHRTVAIDEAVRDRKASTWRELVASGIPVMILEEESPIQAGLDFAALASTKPISSSLRDALDASSPVNAFFLEMSRALDLTDHGTRIEYLSGSVGANSEKLAPFSAFKFAGSQFIVGRRYRSPKPQDAGVNAELAKDEGKARQLWWDRVYHAYDYASRVLPGWKEITEGSLKVPEARKDFISISTVGMTTLMLALHEVALSGEDIVEKAINRLATLNWSRTDKSVLFSTVINRDAADTSKLVTSISRTGFEAGADELVKHLGDMVPAAA
jgi:DGQHR domain-containing protein